MKKIIAFTSFLFLLLLAALPGQVSHAAAATNATALTGISIVTASGEIKAVQNGDSFTFDLYKQDGNQNISEFRFYSDTAQKISIFPYGIIPQSENVDNYDLQFVNGVATLDKAKLQKLVDSINQIDPSNPLTQEKVDSIFTLKGFRQGLHDTFLRGMENPLYVYDANGNQTEITVTFNFGWKLEKGLGWVYYGNDGQLTKGWYNDKNTMDPEAEDEWYYLNPSNGVMKTGWVYTGKWYYLDASGLMTTGWKQVNGKWYYLNPTTGAMQTGWLLDEDKWYFLKSGGDMATGWVKVGNKWYYLNTVTGAMQTGWVYSNGQWFYLNSPSGAMATGWVKVNNKWYYLYSDGHMAKNTKIGRYVIGADGAMK